MLRVFVSAIMLTLVLSCALGTARADEKTSMIIINETNSTIHVTGHFDRWSSLDQRARIADVPPRTRLSVNGVLVGTWQFYATNDQGRKSGPWILGVIRGGTSQLRFGQTSFPP